MNKLNEPKTKSRPRSDAERATRQKDNRDGVHTEAQSDPKSQQILFWRKFALLLSSGVPILESFSIIAEELSWPGLVEAIQDLREKVRQGRLMSDAMREHLDVFSMSACAMVLGGERSGNLDTISAGIANAIESGAIAIGEGSLAGKIEAAPSECPAAAKVRGLIQDAVSARASDIHIDPFADETRVRYRIDGLLHERRKLSKDEYNEICAGIMTLARIDVGLAWRKEPADGRIQMTIDDVSLPERAASPKEPIDIRVSTIPAIHGQTIVMRLLRKDITPQDINNLGLSDANHAMVKSWCLRNVGVIIWTGPTGTGKTTALYALIREINREGTKIVTAENPVESNIEGVIQSEVRQSAGLTFANLVRAQFRQDPDVVMIGEVRDFETAQLVVQVAMTGNLVLTTFHTDDAPSALRRMLDMRLAPFMINDTVIGVACQRLVRVLCQDCREGHVVSRSELEKHGLIVDDDEVKLFKATGCEKCTQTGYRGRTAIHEMFELNDEIRRAVSEEASASVLYQVARDSGMKTMRQDGLEKALMGVTSLREVMRVTGHVGC